MKDIETSSISSTPLK